MARRFPFSRTRTSTVRIFGVAFILIGVILALLAFAAQSRVTEIGGTDDPELQDERNRFEEQRDAFMVTAIGAAFIGLFSIAILVESGTPATASETQMISAARVANQMLAGLSLNGNASYLPAKHGLSKERVFIPATANQTSPPIAVTEDVVVSPGKDGSSPGLIVDPLGRRLLDQIENELKTTMRSAGVESAEGTLQMIKHGLGIVKDFHFKERDGKWLLRIEYASLLSACREVRKEMPDTCRQMACFGCSCILTAMARATEKQVCVEGVDNSKDTVVFTLNLVDW